jgi:DNA-binding transcriptional LysR family regulator
VEVQVEGRLIVTGQPMARGAALAGAGILQTPLPYVAADLAAGCLVSVLEGWPPPAVDGFYLYYPKSRQTRPALKALVEFLRAPRAGSSASRTRRSSQGGDRAFNEQSDGRP